MGGCGAGRTLDGPMQSVVGLDGALRARTQTWRGRRVGRPAYDGCVEKDSDFGMSEYLVRTSLFFAEGHFGGSEVGNVVGI